MEPERTLGLILTILLIIAVALFILFVADRVTV